MKGIEQFTRSTGGRKYGCGVVSGRGYPGGDGVGLSEIDGFGTYGGETFFRENATTKGYHAGFNHTCGYENMKGIGAESRAYNENSNSNNY